MGETCILCHFLYDKCTSECTAAPTATENDKTQELQTIIVDFTIVLNAAHSQNKNHFLLRTGMLTNESSRHSILQVILFSVEGHDSGQDGPAGELSF